MGLLSVTHMGLAGVNVDKDPLELGDNELEKSQNARADVEAGYSTLHKRPGLIAFNTDAITAGDVLGGADLPVQNTSTSGIRSLFIGRGPTV